MCSKLNKIVYLDKMIIHYGKKYIMENYVELSKKYNIENIYMNI